MVHKLVNFIFLRTFASEIKKKVNEECLQDRIKKSLIDKEIIYIEKQGIFLADCVFELWFKKEMM